MGDQIVTEIAIGFALQLVVTLAFAAWGRWVARRMGNGRYWRIVRWTPWASTGLLTIGTVVGVVYLTRTFASLANAENAARKQSLVAEGISNAMNRSAFFMLAGYLLLFVGLVSFIVGSLRRSSEDREP